jgi:hypothetical protein
MANPELGKFDINDTNTIPIPASLTSDGYLTGQTPTASEHNELFKQLFAAANKTKNDGTWEWEDPATNDTEYNTGSIVSVGGVPFISKTDNNTETPSATSIDWQSDIATVNSVEDLATIPNGYQSAIVKDLDRGGTFIWSATSTANGGTVFAGVSGYWVRQHIGIVDVKWFGAKGDLATDDTVAIQNAINAMTLDAGKTIYFQAGIYKVSSTIHIPSTKQGLTIKGEGQVRTMIYRATDYGDTFVFGEIGAASIESTIVEGIFFNHDYGGYENGQLPSTMINKPTAGSHFKLWNPVRLIVRNCMLWNMPRNMEFNGGSKCVVQNCSFRGSFDHAESQLQVTSESILLQQALPAQASALPTDIQIIGNDFGGYLSPLRSVTYGTFTGSISENVGPSAGVRIKAAEVITISGGTVGGHNNAGISVEPQDGVGCLSVFIRGIFFDGNRLAGVRANNNGGTQSCPNLEIQDNIFIGQENSDTAVYIGSSSADAVSSVVGGIISGNSFSTYVKSMIVMQKATGVKVACNIIKDWNTRAGFNADIANASGVYLVNTDNVQIENNKIGGGFGFEAYTGTTMNASYYGITIDILTIKHAILNNDIRKDMVFTPIIDASTSASTSSKRLINNIGFNEDRPAEIPTFPASGDDYYNHLGSPAFVTIDGGTVTQIVLNGQPILTSTPFQIPLGPGDRISIVYTVAPSWVWFPQ